MSPAYKALAEDHDLVPREAFDPIQRQKFELKQRSTNQTNVSNVI